MKIIFKLLILTLCFYLNSCSQLKVKANKARYRKVSSVSRTCINILHNIFDIDLKKIESYTYHWQVDKLEKMSISSLYVRDAIYKSSISSSLGLEKHLKKSLRFKFTGKVNLLDIYNKAIVKKINDINTIDDLKNIFEVLKTLDWPNKDIIGFANESFLVKERIVSNFGEKKLTKNIFEEILLDGLAERSRNISSEKEFFSFFELITNASLSGFNIHELLLKNKIYKNVLDEHPELGYSILNSFRENIRFESKDIFKQIKLAFKSELQKRYKVSAKDITSSYVFFKSIKKYKKNAGDLCESPYAKRLGITREHINEIIKRKGNYEDIIADILPIYKKNKRAFSFDHYDGEVDINGVYDQCSWGSCWLQSNLKLAELKMVHAGEEVELSTDYGYLRFLDSFYKKHILEKQFQDSPFEYMLDEGGTSSIYKHLVRRWGVVPSSVWKPKIRLHSKNIDKFKYDVMSLMYKLKEELVEASTFFEIFSAKKKLNIQKSYLKKMDQLFVDTFGEMPEKFNYKGREYTPQSFMNEYLPGHSEDVNYVRYEKLLGKEEPVLDTQFKEVIEDEVIVTNLKTHIEYKSAANIDQIIIDSIDQDRPVNIGVKWRSSELFIDKNKNIVEYINNENGKIIAPELDNSLSAGGGHAILIIGYELDINGNIKTLKMLNSWGEHEGDRGIFHMDINYFKANLMHLDISKKDGLGFNYFIRPEFGQPFFV